jgi:poly [ADP-ribose] polymerase
MMEKSVVEVGYDAKKLPLGKLSKETVKNGYKILQKIEQVIIGKS